MTVTEIVECANDGTHGCSHTQDRTWKCSRCLGDGVVPNDPPEYDPDAGYLTTAVVLLVCILGSLLFLAAITVGERAMCSIHHDGLRYCAGYSTSAR